MYSFVELLFLSLFYENSIYTYIFIYSYEIGISNYICFEGLFIYFLTNKKKLRVTVESFIVMKVGEYTEEVSFMATI